MSQEQLARIVGIHPQSLGKIESAKTTLLLQLLVQITVILRSKIARHLHTGYRYR